MIARKLVSEALGTGLLMVAVVGSAIMAERLFSGQDGGALLANALVSGMALYVLISVFGPISGAHLNPAVSLVMALRGDLAMSLLVPMIAVQIGGAILGIWLTHAMFDLPILSVSGHARDGLALAETVATFGLVLTILGGIAHAPDRVAQLVAAYIAGAYWFTASTSFANPAATISRVLTDTVAGIAPASLPAFIAAQIIGALLALALGRWLFQRRV